MKRPASSLVKYFLNVFIKREIIQFILVFIFLLIIGSFRYFGLFYIKLGHALSKSYTKQDIYTYEYLIKSSIALSTFSCSCSINLLSMRSRDISSQERNNAPKTLKTEKLWKRQPKPSKHVLHAHLDCDPLISFWLLQEFS